LYYERQAGPSKVSEAVWVQVLLFFQDSKVQFNFSHLLSLEGFAPSVAPATRQPLLGWYGSSSSVSTKSMTVFSYCAALVSRIMQCPALMPAPFCCQMMYGGILRFKTSMLCLLSRTAAWVLQLCAMDQGCCTRCRHGREIVSRSALQHGLLQHGPMCIMLDATLHAKYALHCMNCANTTSALDDDHATPMILLGYIANKCCALS
jgi:hypothetical protein